ncbi:MAG: hypothetical protein WAX69_13955 [Victivallales bacterium]
MTSFLQKAFMEQGLGGRFQGHHPNFHLDSHGKDYHWIMDGEIRVGLVVRRNPTLPGTPFCENFDNAELVNFDSSAPRTVELPPTLHASTHPGYRVPLGMWVDDAQATTSDERILEWEICREKVSATFSEHWANGRCSTKVFTWRMDADFGYVMDCKVRMVSPYRERAEFCNFLAGGLADDRPGFARYPYCLWQHDSGKIMRLNHNNIGARALGAMDMYDRRRIAVGGFIGFFGEKDHNAAVEILNSSHDIGAVTCPCLFDEHIRWLRPSAGRIAQDHEGRFLYEADCRIVSVPPLVSDALARQAQMVDMVTDHAEPILAREYEWCENEFPHRRGQPKHLSFHPFATGQITEFEQKMDPSTSWRGQVFRCQDDNDDAPVTVVSNCGHSGSHSLRIRVDGNPVVIGPDQGCCMHVTGGQRYRLSAWVKTDLETGQVRIAANEWFMSPNIVVACHRSEFLGGRADWHLLRIEFTPGVKHHAVSIFIETEGRGVAWVDDIIMEPLS